MTTRIFRTSLIVASSGVLFIGAAATGQTALGTGHGLDSNLGVGTGGINTPAPAPNFRDRNLIITGDVAGGRGFRGTVGYTAEADFRGALGSNDLFRFRADSAISSPSLFQLGTTYEHLRFGQDVGLIQVRRAGSGDPAAIRAYDPLALSDSLARLRVDRRVAATSMALTGATLAESRPLGAVVDREGQTLLVNASPARGVTVEPLQQSFGLVGLTTFDRARILEDAMTGRPRSPLGLPFEPQFEEAAPEPPAQRLNTQAESPRVNAAVQPDYQRILQRVADRYATMAQANVQAGVSPDLMAQLNQDYRAMRDQLLWQTVVSAEPPGVRPRDPAAAEQLASRPDGVQPQRPGMGVHTDSQRPDAARGPDRLTGEAEPTPPPPRTGYPDSPVLSPSPRDRDERRAPVQPIDFAAILRHGQTVEHLSGPTQDRFNEVLASAEASLRAGEYLQAERRFERALRFAPGHPFATAGAAHAQLGAGLYLSSAFTLRQLFTRQPEMIDVRYDRGLLPAPERIEIALMALRERLSEDDLRDRAAYAFLIAYIGHQSSDRAMVTEGLDAMEKSDPQSALLPLLREIWLADPQEK